MSQCTFRCCLGLPIARAGPLACHESAILATGRGGEDGLSRGAGVQGVVGVPGGQLELQYPETLAGRGLTLVPSYFCSRDRSP